MTLADLMLYLGFSLAGLLLLFLFSYFALVLSAVGILAARSLLKFRLGLRAPRLSVLGRWGRKWLKALHLLAAACWIGSAASTAVVALVMSGSSTDEAVASLSRTLMLMDHYLIIPAALATVGSGILLALLTDWGMTKFYWVIAKWVMAAWALGFGLLIISPWLVEMASAGAEHGLEMLQDPRFRSDSPRNFIQGAVQFMLLVSAAFMSVLRPWARREELEDLN